MNVLLLKIPHKYKTHWVIERAQQTLGLVCKSHFRNKNVEGLFRKIIWNADSTANIYIDTLLEDEKKCSAVVKFLFTPGCVTVELLQDDVLLEIRTSPLFRQLVQRWRSGDNFRAVVELMFSPTYVPQ